MSKDMISIIIPVYKTEKYLKRCIESALNQTYQKLEIILVDDGSPDECPRICDEYAQKDNRIKVIHKENGGVSSARNIALDVAKGKYITFLDSDDFFEQEACEILYKTAIQHNADVVTCGMTMRYSNSSTDVYHENKIYKNNACLYAYLADEIRPEVWAKLFKRTLFDGIRFDKNISYGEDMLLNFKVISKSKYIVNIKDCLYNYEQQNESAATTSYITEARIMSYRITKHILEQSKKSNELIDIATWRHVRGLFAILTRIILGEENKLFDRYFDEIVDEILLYIKTILTSKKYSLKYKYGVFILKNCKWVYVYLIRQLKNSSKDMVSSKEGKNERLNKHNNPGV